MTTIKKVIVAETSIDVGINDHNHSAEKSMMFVNKDQLIDFGEKMNSTIDGFYSMSSSLDTSLEKIVDEAMDECRDEHIDDLEAIPQSFDYNYKEVSVDKLSQYQLSKLLRNYPNLELQKVEGEQISFKTKDQYILKDRNAK